MPNSFLRGGQLRAYITYAMVGLSIAAAGTLAAADGPASADLADRPAGHAATREIDTEDHAQYPGLNLVKAGVSTKAVRKQATSELPMDRLSPDGLRKTQAILKNVGMYRRLPTISFQCEPEVYNYFLKNPDVAVSTWRAMEISQFQLHESGPNQYRADAGDGSMGTVELLFRSPSETLIYCDGAFKSPLLPKPIVARSLMRLQTAFVKEPDGRITSSHTGDVFVEFPSPAVETVAKVIAPVSHSIADRNFKQMTLFVHLMSQAIERHPAWIEQIGNKLEGIPATKKLEFIDVTTRISTQAQRRVVFANGGQKFSPDEVLLPFKQWNVEGGAAKPATEPSGGRTIQTANQTGGTNSPR